MASEIIFVRIAEVIRVTGTTSDTKNLGVDCQDVGDHEESDHARADLSAELGASFFELEISSNLLMIIFNEV